MAQRLSVSVGIIGVVLTLTSCATGSTSAGPASSATAAPAPPGTTSTAVPTTTAASTTTLASTSTTASEHVVEGFDVAVSVSGGGGLLGPVGIEYLVVDDGSRDDTSPWLRFDLVLYEWAGEPNAVVFSPGPDGWATPLGSPPTLRVEGPGCGAVVTCADDSRRVELAENVRVPVTFEVFRLDDLESFAPTTLTAEVDALFDYSHPALTDTPVPLMFRVDVVAAVPEPHGATTPEATPTTNVTTIGGGFGLRQFPFVGVTDDPAQLQAIFLGSAAATDVAALQVDWATQAVVVVAIPSDTCPPLLADLAITDGVARPVFLDPGHLHCEQPLLSFTAIAAVDRSFLQQATEIELPAQMPYFGEALTGPVDVDPPGTASAPVGARVAFGDRRGTADLPRRGEALLATLDDGTPVFVVHHYDGSISALDPRAATEVRGRHDVVSWRPTTRLFVAGGVWDEYGRRLDGFRDTDLAGFATRVVDGVVEIGGPAEGPAGSPVVRTPDPPAMIDIFVEPTAALPLDQARALPIGLTAWIDASVLVDPSGARICDVGAQVGPVALESCPSDAPVAEHFAATPGEQLIWYGPILATRTAAGFDRVASGGAFGGVGL